MRRGSQSLKTEREGSEIDQPLSALASKLQKGGDPTAGSPTVTLLRLSPNQELRVRRWPPVTVSPATWPLPPFRGLTGGVYKAQEHIHRGVADPRLLAIPASRRRVAAFDLNWAALFGIGSPSRVRFPLYAAL